MRYIRKVSPPSFFTNAVEDFTNWNQYSVDKEQLREYILESEQNYLCIYCESKISACMTSSHIEHIKPKGKYPKLTFEYINLTVSCNGNCNNQDGDDSKNSCGHIKENEYSEEKFLNPVEIEDIREYFSYDFDKYSIEPSDKNNFKSKYMINTLKLNDFRLTLAREKALNNFIIKMKKIENITTRKQKIKDKLDQENIEQISFLRYKYRNLL